jgi:hypothetical protein
MRGGTPRIRLRGLSPCLAVRALLRLGGLYPIFQAIGINGDVALMVGAINLAVLGGKGV